MNVRDQEQNQRPEEGPWEDVNIVQGQGQIDIEQGTNNSQDQSPEPKSQKLWPKIFHFLTWTWLTLSLLASIGILLTHIILKKLIEANSLSHKQKYCPSARIYDSWFNILSAFLPAFFLITLYKAESFILKKKWLRKTMEENIGGLRVYELFFGVLVWIAILWAAANGAGKGGIVRACLEDCVFLGGG